MTFSDAYMEQAGRILEAIDLLAIEEMVAVLKATRDEGGRLFIIGSGGGAGHASHAACDFRKLCDLEAYCPTDNVTELSARINDDGWDTSISSWLKGSRLNASDCVFVFSVGGGSRDENISMNLVNAVSFARDIGARVVGAVGRDGGYTATVADACVVIPAVDGSLVTPHTESFQAMVWHLIVSHPDLQVAEAKWESTGAVTKSNT